MFKYFLISSFFLTSMVNSCQLNTIDTSEIKDEEFRNLDSLTKVQFLQEINERNISSDDLILRFGISQAFGLPDYIVSVRRVGYHFFIHEKIIYEENIDSIHTMSCSRRLSYKELKEVWLDIIDNFDNYYSNRPIKSEGVVLTTETIVSYELSYNGAYRQIEDVFYSDNSKAFYLSFVEKLPLSNYPLIETVKESETEK